MESELELKLELELELELDRVYGGVSHQRGWQDMPHHTNTTSLPRGSFPPRHRVFSHSDVVRGDDVPACSRSGMSNGVVDGGTITCRSV